MNKNKLSVYILSGCLALSFSLTPAFAGNDDFPPKPMGDRCPHERPKFDLAKELNLTAEQKQQAEALRSKDMETLKSLDAQIRTQKEKINQLEKSGASDVQIKAEKEKMKTLFNQKRAIFKKSRVEFEKILTSEQKAKLQKMKECERRGPRFKKPDLAKELNLTAEQKKKADKLREKGRKNLEPIMKQIKAEREKINQLEKSGASDVQIKAEKEKMKVLFDKAKVIHEKNFKEFEKILTPEQKAKLEELKPPRPQER